MKQIDARIRKLAADYPAFHFLQRTVFELPDAIVLGCTLWTDLKGGEEVTAAVEHVVNDYKFIYVNGVREKRQARVADIHAEFEKDVAFLQREIAIHRGGPK